MCSRLTTLGQLAVNWRGWVLGADDIRLTICDLRFTIERLPCHIANLKLSETENRQSQIVPAPRPRVLRTPPTPDRSDHSQVGLSPQPGEIPMRAPCRLLFLAAVLVVPILAFAGSSPATAQPTPDAYEALNWRYIGPEPGRGKSAVTSPWDREFTSPPTPAGPGRSWDWRTRGEFPGS